MLREADARRIATELDQYEDVRARARPSVGPYWAINVTLGYATAAEGRPLHFVISDRDHGESCARAQRERHGQTSVGER
jgi:hypothetical protein